LVKKPRQEFSDPEFEKLRKLKRNNKFMEILRLLTESMMTCQELARRTRLSVSKVKQLVKVGEESGHIEIYQREGGVKRSPGKKGKNCLEKKTGRPEMYCLLTGKARWLLRLDSEVCDQWPQEGVKYEGIIEYTDLDSYQDLEYAIRKHPKLSRYRKAWNLMGQDLQGILLKPFIVGNEHKQRDPTTSDDLVNVIKQNVRSEHILPYYFVLRDSLTDITEVLECNKLLLSRMKKLPEVLAYLEKTKGKS
jgi:hypothetical protein